ncbi:MAG: glycosyltransferase family 2 protein [Lachnospiraceae bacterium]|nr:glycosyltransferase family 2 protein [Lachnospiraceae bacterium]
MQEVTVVIPNLNGMKYLEGCLNSLRKQTRKDFEIILVDNGSKDESVAFVRKNYPEVRILRLSENTGFCHAVNRGIRLSDSPYVILLNNDVACRENFVEELVKAIRQDARRFSCAARMMKMDQPMLLDDAGDYYCALGWAFAAGKGRPAGRYAKERRIFAACGGASIYRKELLEKLGLFDEKHFAYLEDIDIGYRARIAGYENRYIPSAVVYHAGSGTSGSAYNAFKVKHASRNSVYLIYKNMPLPQILLNLPFLAAGYLIKICFFAKKGFLGEYVGGLRKGFRMCERENKVVFRKKNLKHYVQIQFELWFNVLRRIGNF